MLRHTFVPDYTVRAVTEVFYVRIKRSLYLAAKRATLMERSQKDPQPSQDQFDDEVEKVRPKSQDYNSMWDDMLKSCFIKATSFPGRGRPKCSRVAGATEV